MKKRPTSDTLTVDRFRRQNLLSRLAGDSIQSLPFSLFSLPLILLTLPLFVLAHSPVTLSTIDIRVAERCDRAGICVVLVTVMIRR